MNPISRSDQTTWLTMRLRWVGSATSVQLTVRVDPSSGAVPSGALPPGNGWATPSSELDGPLASQPSSFVGTYGRCTSIGR